MGRKISSRQLELHMRVVYPGIADYRPLIYNTGDIELGEDVVIDIIQYVKGMVLNL